MRRFGESCLWLGNHGDIEDFRTLFHYGIKVVVDLALEEQATPLPREFVYLRFPLLDGPGNPDWLLHSAIATTARFIAASIPTLVVCGMGMSRSPCIAAVALAQACGGDPDQYLASLVASGPHDVAPGLWAEVLDSFRSNHQFTRSAASPTPTR